MGAASINDLKNKISSGEIKFSKDATAFFSSCHAGGWDRIESETPAVEFTIATGVPSIACTGYVFMKDPKNANGKIYTEGSGSFYRITRVSFEKEVQVKNSDKTSSWQFWKSDTVRKKVKDYTVKTENLGNEISVDDYIK